MNISILSVKQINEHWTVKFSNKFGIASARWYGGEPKAGASANVELDSDNWEFLGNEGKKYVPHLNDDESQESVIAVGVVEALAENGIVVLRIGDDLLQCECSSEQFGVGDWISIRTKELQAHEVKY